MKLWPEENSGSHWKYICTDKKLHLWFSMPFFKTPRGSAAPHWYCHTQCQVTHSDLILLLCWHCSGSNIVLEIQQKQDILELSSTYPNSNLWII